MQFTTEIFSQFTEKWGLLTAGKSGDFNTMTIGWGGLGTLWSKPVATVYIRKSRYTHEFIDREEYFTISFFGADKRDILVTLGNKSGREIDKINNSGLTPKAIGDSVTFEEAEVTILCKKLYMQELDLSAMPDDVKKTYYDKDSSHDMYIGEVIEIQEGH
ncbi:MAG: flavin reductase [Eubacterium sp.]|nr:flavin reductase [Eubacterium sp.]